MHSEFSGAGKGGYEVCASNECKHGCAGEGEQEMCAEKGKEKTDEGSSVLLYFMTEEGERE